MMLLPLVYHIWRFKSGELGNMAVAVIVVWVINWKDFEAGNELFQVSEGRDAASGHTPSRSRRLQVPESCNHSCTYCKECKMKGVKFHHGQSLCHFTLTEGAKAMSRNAGASPPNEELWLENQQ
ncbi:hypothetical protein CY35_02G063700 [Sphagnum magellanicum]|nr:hypothetical protein CY35_02G063700 [Sphagnum magellanicum]